MSRIARAVICRELNKPVVVDEIRVDPPKRGEVTVKLGQRPNSAQTSADTQDQQQQAPDQSFGGGW